MTWTPEKEAELIRRVEVEKQLYRQIAHHFGTTRRACIGKYHRLVRRMRRNGANPCFSSSVAS